MHTDSPSRAAFRTPGAWTQSWFPLPGLHELKKKTQKGTGTATWLDWWLWSSLKDAGSCWSPWFERSHQVQWIPLHYLGLHLQWHSSRNMCWITCIKLANWLRPENFCDVRKWEAKCKAIKEGGEWMTAKRFQYDFIWVGCLRLFFLGALFVCMCVHK